MQIRWEADAISDLIELRHYIEQENPEAANRVASKIVQSADTLLDHPLLGKAGRLHKTRELVVSGTPYTVIYFAESELVTILRVFHQSRSWSHIFE